MLSPHVRTLLTRATLPIWWRGGNQFAASTLKRFSEVEFDSAWQYLNAMAYAKDPNVQLMLFSNLLEEMEHSDAFEAVSHKLSAHRLSGSRDARVQLVKSPADIPYFLAFAHESERAICAQFAGFARACRQVPDAVTVFTSIAGDEVKHEQAARAALVAIVGKDRTLNWLLVKVKLSKTYAAWMRGGRRVGDVIFGAVFGGLYFALGAAFRGYCARRLSGRLDGTGVRSDRPGAPLVIETERTLM